MKSSKKSNLSKNGLSRLIFFAFFLCGSSSCSNELQEITDNDVKTATVTLSVDEGNALKIKKKREVTKHSRARPLTWFVKHI